MIPAAIAPLASHLWQSTMFAAVMGLLTLALRRNQARVRYWLWLAASYKFLVPFSWLVSVGHHFEWRAAPVIVPTAFSSVTDALSGPIFLTAFPAARPAPAHLSLLLFAICAIWACGFVAVVAGWAREWLRIRAMVRAAKPLPLGLPIRVVSTPARLEPGVFGIIRPVLLLPEGIAVRLTQAQLQAVLAHELSHVRRRDNLAAAVHMLIEALFWFYPLVWWLGARLMDERERACDEEVLRLGGEPEAYAEGILSVCKLYMESPVACVSGISGSDLKKRIVRIMTLRLPGKLTVGRKLLLAAIGIAAVVGPLVFGLLALPPAQSPAVPQWQTAAGGKMAFDVASVKPNKATGRPISNIPFTHDDAYSPTGGLFSATDNTLRSFIWFAYKIQQIPVGFPDWGNRDRFDIEARAQGNPTKDQYRLMMQSLLADRFKLAAHFETRQVPIYALVQSKEGKTGPQLKPDDGACSTTPADIQALNAAPPLPPPATLGSPSPPIPCGTLLSVPANAPGRIRIAGTKVTMAVFAMSMANPVSGITDRLPIDYTGLRGTFDVSIEWAPRLNGPAPPGFTPDADGPTFTEALQDQLGLKLVPQTGPVDVLVIDHVEQPSGN